MELARIEAALAARGLVQRGAFHPRAEDAVPALADGRPAGTLVLVGNAGPDMWRAFARARPSGPDPLDRWSAIQLAEVASGSGARVLLPSEPWPFLRWAHRAGGVHPSPIGILIDPDFGLWHAYRGALAFAERLGLFVPDARPSPCSSCADQPCLTTCPVDAFSAGAYDVEACVGHVGSPDGSACLLEGCLARRACPVAPAARYEPAQARFHMEAFLRARRSAQGR
jgi:hypothetical protein